jgi:N6-adenosine-specific RNA methylase IME4
MKQAIELSASEDFKSRLAGKQFGTILADPPWQFQNRTGKVAPEHKRLARYGTMDLNEIMQLPVASAAADTAHLYLWVPNALLPDGIAVMAAWGFKYKSNLGSESYTQKSFDSELHEESSEPR